MQHSRAFQRFRYLREAFYGEGGFDPVVVSEDQPVTVTLGDGTTTTAYRRVPKIAGICHLAQHPRETPERYASRAEMAVYENHLREACERFVGFLSRRRPLRSETQAPLTQLLLANADMRGNSLDAFFAEFALKAKAYGSMLLLLDMPSAAPAESMADQIARRAVPYLSAVDPENVKAFEISESGRFEWVEIQTFEDAGDGEGMRILVRRWDSKEWSIKDQVGKVIRSAPHGFNSCPVVPFTESGMKFPCLGKYAQVADLSKAIYNHRSRLDELLAGQTFSILTFQIPQNTSQPNPAAFTASVGVNSMLPYPGERPDFVSPDQGNAETHLKVIAECQAAIRRITQDDAASDTTAGVESGLARKVRFERLNAELSSFALRMQQLEMEMWRLFASATGTESRVSVAWPTDFNLVDSVTELSILAEMQNTGFPDQVLAAKRTAIVASEFDSVDEAEKSALIASVVEQAQQPKK
jgi:hypothetical protein